MLASPSFVTQERMIRVLCVVLYKTGDASQVCVCVCADPGFPLGTGH